MRRRKKPANESGARLALTGKAGDDAVKLARIALAEARPASEIIGILEPALRGTRTSARAALALIARDQLLLKAMDYAPGPSLRVMRRAFADGQYGQLVASWPDLKPYYPLLPDGLKRQVDYHMGVARLNLGELVLALDHLRAARRATPSGAEASRLDKLIILARLSVDKPPKAMHADCVGQKYVRPPQKIEKQRAIDDPPPTPEEALDDMLDLRARIVLARHAAAQADWATADGYLTGIGPTQSAYQLFLGMRVRLLAEAVRGRLKKGESVKAVRSIARGGHILYRLWRDSDCLPGCPRSNRLAVHRAAFETALMARLNSTAFGLAWGGFVDEGGDIKPFVGQALPYLIDQADGERLMAMLENDNEDLAAFTLGQWKSHLSARLKKPDFDGRYQFLSALADMQGRPHAVLLEALVEHDLTRERPARRRLSMLKHWPSISQGRPSAWFCALPLCRPISAGWKRRALYPHWRSAPRPMIRSAWARGSAWLPCLSICSAVTRPAPCAKIFSRPQAESRWRNAAQAFPPLKDWQKTTDRYCG